MSDSPSDSPDAGYQVLARKYRPETFADLVGQDAMVRTLKNAFHADRIAQAFILTGIRGTGKTTTARIIAKGMNCIGPEGQSGPTTDPCGKCEHCRAIIEGRHVDVIEMDAASNTGVDNIRDAIIDSIAYAPGSARYKVFVIDEVHMLSTHAFNALLKTLEEPPAHVKFIFATTEIRKVPVTVLSRCQRFDLRRIEPEDMIALLRRIAEAEDAEISGDALALITRAAEGSARDATSLLDQAISHGAGETTVEQVRAMLGLADRGRVLDLFEAVMRGDAAGALAELAAQYAGGADPLALLRDLAEVTHWISVVKVAPDAAEDPTIGPDERARGQRMAERLPMRALTRMWQMLLRALDEVAAAPNAMMATEMTIIRLTHVADLPSPEELVRKLRDAPPGAPPSGPGGGASAAQGGATGAALTGGHGGPRTGAASNRSGGAQAQAKAQTQADPLAGYARFEDVVALIGAQRDVKLLVDVEAHLRLVRYSPGRIEFHPTPDAPGDLAPRLGAALGRWTGGRWAVSVVDAGGSPTIAETRDDAEARLRAEAARHPMVQAVLTAFPKARITAVRSDAERDAAAGVDALAPAEEAGDNWDPFEDD